jgi:hypothetical protein
MDFCFIDFSQRCIRMNIKLPLAGNGKNAFAPLMSPFSGMVSGESVNMALTIAVFLKSPYCGHIFNILIYL